MIYHSFVYAHSFVVAELTFESARHDMSVMHFLNLFSRLFARCQNSTLMNHVSYATLYQHIVVYYCHQPQNSTANEHTIRTMFQDCRGCKVCIAVYCNRQQRFKSKQPEKCSIPPCNARQEHCNIELSAQFKRPP